MTSTFSFGFSKREFHITKIQLALGLGYVLYFYLGVFVGKVVPYWLVALVFMNIILAQAIYYYHKELKKWQEQ